MNKSVLAIVESQLQGETAVRELQERGIRNRDVSRKDRRHRL